MLRPTLKTGLVLLALAAASGCGSSLPSVTGKVTLDGAAMTSGTMTFHPSTVGALGYATIGSDGAYTARTGAVEGLAPGAYTVTITAFKPLPAATKENPYPKADSLLPARYADVKTSDQKITVTEDGENNFELPLKSQ